MRGSLVVIIHAVISMTVIIAATILAANGDIDSQAVVAIFGASIGLAGGIGGAIAVNGSGKIKLPGEVETVVKQTAEAADASAARTVAAAEASAARTVEAAEATAARTATPPA